MLSVRSDKRVNCEENPAIQQGITDLHKCASGSMIAQHMLASALGECYSRTDLKKVLNERIGMHLSR